MVLRLTKRIGLIHKCCDMLYMLFLILNWTVFEVRLLNTRKEELLNGNLDLVLMYAIGPAARKTTETAG